MSSPVQLPVLNPKQSAPSAEKHQVKPAEAPEPTKNKGQENFKDAMQAADKRSEQRAASDAEHRDQSQPAEAAANSSGKELPPEETSSETETVFAGTQTQILVEETLQLNFNATELSAEQADDALLLATRFVVDSLPAVAKEAASDGVAPGATTASKPDILLQLQAQMSKAALAPKTQLMSPEGLVQGAITELTSLKDAATSSNVQNQVDALSSQTNQTNAAELKAAAQTTATKTEMVVPNKVGSEGWSEAMAGRISLLVNQRISAARIHINPPELGPIEVRVNLNNDQASVQFTSQSAQVRDALEQSIPRLRDMLESAGFSLADSDVNDQGREQGSQSDGESGSEMVEEAVAQPTKRESLGLVDDYV
jgi:flagellar hook-length control protein FliK